MFEWELHSQVQEGGVTVGGKDQDQVKPWDGKVPERGGTVEDLRLTSSNRSGLVSKKEVAQWEIKLGETTEEERDFVIRDA